jgi:tRNA(Ile)-lysidine synthase
MSQSIKQAFPRGFTLPEILSGLPSNSSILVGFSGGADSSALLRMIHQYGMQNGAEVFAAHINHGIRGAEADRDENFCRKTADALGIKLFVLNADVPAIAKERGESIETAARNVRYEFFDKIMTENHIPILATAHNANDNLETVIFNIARGCALGGVCGIPNSRPCGEGKILIRPILNMERREILEYCENNKIDFVTDSTNTDTDYTRNKIRSHIIPLLEEINSGAVKNTARLCESLRADSLCLESMTNWFLDEMRDDYSIEAEKICLSPPSIANRALSHIYSEISFGGTLEYKHIEAIRALAQKAVPHSSIDLPAGITASIEGGRLIFAKSSPKQQRIDSYRIELSEGENKISQTNTEIFIGTSQKQMNIYKKSTLLFLDSAKICGSLYARGRAEGDKIRMRGMSKSVKKLMCDMKIPIELRSRIPIICDDKGILAIPFVGVRDGLEIKKADPEDMPKNALSLQIYLH